MWINPPPSSFTSGFWKFHTFCQRFRETNAQEWRKGK